MSWASKPVKSISVDGLLHEPLELQAFRNSFLFKHSESLHPVSCWGDIGGCLWEICRHQVWKGPIGNRLDKQSQRRQHDSRIEFCTQEEEVLGFILSCFTLGVPVSTTIT